jgi:hypothetical protein
MIELEELDEMWDETIYSEWAFYASYILQIIFYCLVEQIGANV